MLASPRTAVGCRQLLRAGTATGESPATSPARLRWKRENHALVAASIAELMHCSSTVHCTVVLFIHYSPARKQCKSRAVCRTYWPCSKKVPGSSRTPGKPQGIPGTLARQARTATALAHMNRARSGSTCGVAPPIGHRIHTKGNKNEPSPSPL